MRRPDRAVQRRVRPFALAITLAGGLLLLFGPAAPAAADAGWSRDPASGLAGGSIQVASSSTTLCRWLGSGPTATDVGGDPVAVDGSAVEIRLTRSGADIPLGAVPVTPGGAWAGTVTVPGTDVAPPGEYDLVARCVVDHPDLEGVRSFDFDPQDFTVVEGPPPTTVTSSVTTTPPSVEIGEPATLSRPEVQGDQLDRSPPTAATATPVRTLPNTGNGTLTVTLAGFGALALGAGALWLGTRRGIRNSDPRALG